MESIARRGLLLGGSALCGAMVAPAILRGEPQYRLKFANIMPADHPLNTRMAEAAKAINEQTNGQVEIPDFPCEPARHGQ